MSSRIEKMLAKTQGVRAAKDIPESEIVRSATPKTAVGTMAAWQASQARIEELEKMLVGTSDGKMIPVVAISPNPWQPRRMFDQKKIDELASSIGEIGLVQPVIVRRVPNRDTFQIVAGERRLRAHQSLGMLEIKAVVMDIPDEDMIALALAENYDREDLADYEIALAIKSASESKAVSKKDLAKALGISRSDLYRHLAFFKLPDFVVSDLENSPSILGANAAESIVVVLEKHGDKGVDVLSHIWPHVRSGNIEQGKIAPLIEASLTRGKHVRAERDIRKLFVGKDQVGSITRDAASLVVKIKAAALSPEKENQLKNYVESLLRQDKTSAS